MFLLRQPSSAEVSNFILQQKDLPWSYAEVGATRGQLPAGYVHDHNRIQLGVGGEAFERAVAAFRRWIQFDLGWIRIMPADASLEVGTTVAIEARTLGVWSLSAARIVYTIDDTGEVTRFGFAYGTLPDHVERGEERFMIEWNTNNGSVCYDLTAFSQPRHWLLRGASPVARRLQKRFARESLLRMQSVIQN